MNKLHTHTNSILETCKNVEKQVKNINEIVKS